MKKLIKGLNDLETINPALAKEWNYNKNSLKPFEVSFGSGKKVWWKCSNGHEWQAVISSRNNGRGCPYCSGSKPIVGETDLKSKYPKIAKEWDYEKNDDKKPSEYTCGSREPIWWKCSKGHSYKQIIIKRTTRGYNCPYCSNEKVLKGFNDLETVNPKLAKEWNYKKNKTTPDMYTNGSGFRAWWICPLGHEYKATIHDRTAKGGTNCPICNMRNSSSFPEQAIYFYVKKIYPNAINKYKDIFKNSMELDIYIPDIKLGIEFDGGNWHKTEEQHKSEIKKYNICKKNGIYLIRIKENNGTNWKDTFDIAYRINKSKNTDELQNVIQAIMDSIDKESNMLTRMKPIFHSSVVVDLEKDRNHILSYLSNIENSLLKLRPDVIEYWDFDKNIGISPNMFSVGSTKKVWWKCKTCGYEWHNSITGMTRKGRNNCPMCSRKEQGLNSTKKKVIEKGSLADNNPSLAKEWHPSKNGTLTPKDITEGRFKPVWWLCSKCGYEWQASPNTRKRGIGCPCCSGRVPKIGENDLETWCIKNRKEKLLKDWNYEKNSKKPSQYLPFSSQKVNWKCYICGYEWKTVISIRTKGESECPSCSKRRIVQGINDLETLRPDIANEWDYDKNVLKPNEVGCGADNKIWWLCSNGHSYQSRIASRTGKNRNDGCPYCSNKKILIGYNDLQTTYPEIAKEWNQAKNGVLKPTDVTRGNGKKVWWKCSKGHEWQTTILERTNGSRCPYCSGKKAIKGETDLSTIFPEVIKYWDTNKNTLLPSDVLPHSEKIFWWKCPNCGNKWEARACDMVKRKNKCLKCK